MRGWIDCVVRAVVAVWVATAAEGEVGAVVVVWTADDFGGAVWAASGDAAVLWLLVPAF